MTPDREQPRARTGVVHRSDEDRISEDPTTPKFGSIAWAAAWRAAHPTGPFEPLIVAEAAWRAADEGVD